VEKMNDYVNNISKSYESKYQELENKMSNNDKNLMIVSQRTSSGSDVLNEMGDKIMARLNTSESNLLMLGVHLDPHRKSK
jgi:phosphopentomutase